MNTPSLRAFLLLAAIFATGVWTGHLLSRRPLVVQASISNPVAPEKAAGEASPDGDNTEDRRTLIRETKRVMERYQQALSVDDDTMQAFKPLFVSTSMEISSLPKDSPRRRQLVEKMHQDMAPRLTPEQREICAEILRQSNASKSAPLKPGS